MAAPATPQNFIVQTGNIQNLINWGASATALSYDVERSLDNTSFVSIATPTLLEYLDTAVSPGVTYYYRVIAVNGDGPSAPTASQSLVPAPAGEMSLGQIRRLAQERADMVNSNFVSKPSWNQFINQAMFELYDILTTVFEDYNKAEVQFTTTANVNSYALPNGVNYSGARPFYKVLGLDLSLGNQLNAWVTLGKYMFLDRNRYIFPAAASTIYGVFNMQYRIMGNNIDLIPAPSSNQIIRVHYIPRLEQLLKDNDVSTIGVSGWLEYVIVRAAKYALDKEESDTSVLGQEIVFLKERIEQSAANRDAGRPDRITDSRIGGNGNGYGNGYGFNGPIGGY